MVDFLVQVQDRSMIISFETNKKELTVYLRSHGLLDDDDVMDIVKPGEGNMNFVARIKTQRRSFILKQANPYVQKYPEIAAPVERIMVEAEFYKIMQKFSTMAASMPSLLGVDAENHIIALQDLGEATDCTFLYQKGNSLTGTEVEKLVAFLNELHAIPFDRLTAYPDNYTLRKLNYEHLFQFPFMRDNGFDLNGIQQGLQELAVQYKTDTDFVKRIKKLGSNYLSRGTSLLHGDYYPGSWLKTKTDLKIIDPEFSFVGNREFDVGVFISHLKMARSSEALIAQATSNYQADRNFNWDLCYQFAGVETMRRIIGLAQLPMDLTLQEKEILLNEAYSLI